MTQEDVLRYARRDWAALAMVKEQHWLRHRRSATYAELLRLSDDLHRHVRLVLPNTPSQADRLADIEVHRRVGCALRAVTVATR